MHAIWLMVGFISNLTTTNGLCITKDKVSIAYSLDTLFDKMVHMDKITMGYFLVENDISVSILSKIQRPKYDLEITVL